MTRKLLFLTTALISGFSALPANAGFEWNPAPAKQVASPGSTMPQASGDMGGPLTPMPGDMPMGASAKVEPVMEADIMDNGTQMAPVTQNQNQPGMRSLNTTAPQNLTGQSSESDLMLPVPGEMANMPQGQAATVEGFGKDIPLAVALRQVLPSGYDTSFDNGVDQGKPVSWKGGRAWTQVVSDMLKSRKLHAKLSGNTVVVSEGAGPDLQMSAPSTMTADASPMMKPGQPVIDMGMQKRWTAPAGQSLRQTLSDWSGQASVELAWQDAKDSPINSAFSYDGTFDQAVDALLSLYGGGSNEPHGKLYPNLPEGPSVLVIGSN